jgi:hypothetical protein
MQQLTDEQIDTIELRIAADGVTNTGLQNDLLDHYCCHIEQQMNEGTDFDTAYQNAFTAITPNGMHEIQEELFFLLTINKQINMKRIIYGSGFLAAFLINLGILFRTLHWPGASAILFGGFAALLITIFVLGSSAIRHLRKHTFSYNFRQLSGLIAGLLIASGNMFKINHFPTANIQILIGMVILSFFFMPLFFYHLYKQSLAKG